MLPTANTTALKILLPFLLFSFLIVASMNIIGILNYFIAMETNQHATCEDMIIRAPLKMV